MKDVDFSRLPPRLRRGSEVYRCFMKKDRLCLRTALVVCDREPGTWGRGALGVVTGLF